MTTLTIKNDGQNIVSSNYWTTEYAIAGAFYISVNASAFRLLVPDSALLQLPDMRMAKMVVVSIGPNPEWKRDTVVELLFDDGTESPFVIHCGKEQIDRIPSVNDSGRLLDFIAYTRGLKEQLRTKCGFRYVSKIPCLESWGKEID